MYTIQPTPQFREICPRFRGRAVYAEIRNSQSNPALWDEIGRFVSQLRAKYTTATIKQRAGILATREAYKAAGKDPSRYRPACEQLARRIIQGKDLYRVDTVVDLVNLLSLSSSYSTAALDAGHIVGEALTLDFGREGEPYEGIGRGPLNIANLPVYRDAAGAFATPTSDSTRTMLSLETHRLLVLINGYDGDEANLDAAAKLCIRLLEDYAEGKDFEVIKY